MSVDIQLADVIPRAPHKLYPGLKRLDLDDWLDRDENFEVDLANRQEIVAKHKDLVFGVKAGSESAVAELVDLVRQAPQSEPFGSYGHSLLDAALSIQEDLCILEKTEPDGPYRLTAACVCFPSFWNVRDKLGHSLDVIHGPVPGYKEELSKALNRVFERITVDTPMERQNGFLALTHDLYTPATDGHFVTDKGSDIETEDVGRRVFLRSERQTLRRLPQSNAVVFTIHSYRWPLEQISDKSDLKELYDHLTTMPEAMQAYKSLPGYRRALFDWFERQLA